MSGWSLHNAIGSTLALTPALSPKERVILWSVLARSLISGFIQRGIATLLQAEEKTAKETAGRFITRPAVFANLILSGPYGAALISMN
jgi:hypothetical protein